MDLRPVSLPAEGLENYCSYFISYLKYPWHVYPAWWTLPFQTFGHERFNQLISRDSRFLAVVVGRRCSHWVTIYTSEKYLNMVGPAKGQGKHQRFLFLFGCLKYNSFIFFCHRKIDFTLKELQIISCSTIDKCYREKWTNV